MELFEGKTIMDSANLLPENHNKIGLNGRAIRMDQILFCIVGGKLLRKGMIKSPCYEHTKLWVNVRDVSLLRRSIKGKFVSDFESPLVRIHAAIAENHFNFEVTILLV